MRRLRYLFRIYDYQNSTLCAKILGLPLLKKANVLTLSFFGLPLAQRKTFRTLAPYGGGGS